MVSLRISLLVMALVFFKKRRKRHAGYINGNPNLLRVGHRRAFSQGAVISPPRIETAKNLDRFLWCHGCMLFSPPPVLIAEESEADNHSEEPHSDVDAGDDGDGYDSEDGYDNPGDGKECGHFVTALRAAS